MPSYNNPGNPGGGEDYYSAGDETPMGRKPDGENQEQDEGNYEEVQVSKAILGGRKDFKVGDEVELEITAISDDTVTVRYATPHEEPHDEKQADEGETPPNPGGGMDRETASMY